MGQKKLGFALLVSSSALTLVACGSGSSGGASGFTSASQLHSAMASPTGTVEPATAVGIAEAFQSSESSGLGGVRQKLQAQSTTVACTGGGSMAISGSQNSATVAYNDCVLVPGCTVDGVGSTFIEDVNNPTNICFSYDVSQACDDISVDLDFSGCIDVNLEGGFAYLVEYAGETYTVSGSYYDGTGTLSIAGENGSFSCTYSANAGSCTSDGGTFEFTPASADEDLGADDLPVDR
jgi:hypothetical protein